jgi:DUF971 family protein
MRPSNITANRQTGQMTITWDDGHQSVYQFSLLRNACPCAECRGGHDQMGQKPDPAVFELPIVSTPATRLSQIQAVGAYAISLEWEDGHHYGIYTWKFLRELCSCEVCRENRQT